MPVYLLTSHRTGSAAEGFAYALQQSRRAKAVGETTLGMAHPCEEVSVNSRFLISVPMYRVVSAFAAKSFQGVGIRPDINVPEQNALEAAWSPVTGWDILIFTRSMASNSNLGNGILSPNYKNMDTRFSKDTACPGFANEDRRVD